ncbi:ABC transporter permease [Paraburkholderia sp. J8-2]|uniref:ABC transporter permease n=1 Tax=Paraburkholderia sp. J8-2 TaxID=2805440 RepID=UPI002AB6DF3D|nr:ABC transporter permease [Paraburkholderia sp. J8-2]
MKPPRPAEPANASGNPIQASVGDAPRAPLVSLVAKTLAIGAMEVRKLRHDPTELATRAVQPVLWLLVFGQVMSRGRVIDTGGAPYLDFLTFGILAQSVLFIAIFNGISVIWERDLGIVHKLLASPTPRAALVLGKSLGGGVRTLVQAAVVMVLALAIGVHLRVDPVSIAGVAFFVVLGAAVFSSFSLIIACIVKTRERFMGVGQVLTVPLFFASNAIYPTSLMPRALQIVSEANPLSYQVDALRRLLLPGFASVAGSGLVLDAAVLAAAVVVLVALCARLYPDLAR